MIEVIVGLPESPPGFVIGDLDLIMRGEPINPSVITAYSNIFTHLLSFNPTTGQQQVPVGFVFSRQFIQIFTAAVYPLFNKLFSG